MYINVDIHQALYEIADVPMVDLRSPGEYAEATIPGAYNIPLLDNIERALVGTVHKNQGPGKARELAMEIVAPRLPVFIRSFQSIAPDKEVIIFCWRGGDRSHFAGSILDAMGFKVYRIVGGFKAHRRLVVAYFDREKLPLRAVVTHGLTGVGKTDLLLALKDMGYPVLDLEGLARHRGSVFGKIGQPPSPKQKMFEALIERELRGAEKTGIFLVECESKRLGSLYVPDAVLNNMQEGHRILLYAPVNVRVQRIIKDYAVGGPGNLVALQGAIARLTKYLGKNNVARLNQELAAGNAEEVISYLLHRYYDPLYKYPDQPSDAYDLSINTENMSQAIKKVSDFINGLPEYTTPRG
ncbi:tRNA 2-selenouridine(34) synthase MnmH [Desulfallas thermosapovorans]|uniref:tRNA 2-selenouridine synthase n=1 Tax=Desulfallas thermosapovorans DSM 6562 TaxID=1121431 RepID=A0A5S4ZXS5_9FIRM|nr:tRNA 2-selenouridine(34) synthase MnmH [Desulfallas thermosapovorans]TYO97863.1 tRNA 2-selenouridine synthase [Desulfallas thermosapovorans DSM 6562]